MVESIIRALRGWPKSDKRDIALALVKHLDLSDLAEVLAAAHQRIHSEADKRKQSKQVGGRSEK